MRKWYGETDKLVMPKDGGPQGPDREEEKDEPSGPREAVVVVGGDSELGQLVVLQLVLARCAFIQSLQTSFNYTCLITWQGCCVKEAVGCVWCVCYRLICVLLGVTSLKGTEEQS